MNKLVNQPVPFYHKKTLLSIAMLSAGCGSTFAQ